MLPLMFSTYVYIYIYIICGVFIRRRNRKGCLLFWPKVQPPAVFFGVVRTVALVGFRRLCGRFPVLRRSTPQSSKKKKVLHNDGFVFFFL